MGSQVSTNAILLKYRSPNTSNQRPAQGSYELLSAISYNCGIVPYDMRYHLEPYGVKSKEEITTYSKKREREILDDIKTIVLNYPESLHTELGFMRCRFCLTPLQIAIMNPFIPIDLIQWLLDNGARPNLFYNTSLSNRIHLFNDDIIHIDQDRRDAITKLLENHPEYVGPQEIVTKLEK